MRLKNIFQNTSQHKALLARVMFWKSFEPTRLRSARSCKLMKTQKRWLTNAKQKRQKDLKTQGQI